jgi:hypothetical protein
MVVWSTESGRQRLTIRALNDRDGAYAFAPSGHIELFGNVREFPICRIGAASFPFELCAERYLTKGLVAMIAAGSDAYLEP